MHEETKRGSERSHDPEKRRKAVAIVAAGHSPDEVATQSGVARATIFRWLKRVREGGEAALENRPRSGRSNSVPDDDLMKVARNLLSTPESQGYQERLWSRAIVRKELEKLGCSKVSKWTENRIFERLGLMPIRGSMRKWREDDGTVGNWSRRNIDKLKAAAQKIEARLYLVDLAPVPNDSLLGRTATPVAQSAVYKIGWTLATAVATNGAWRFVLVLSRDETSALIQLIKRLMDEMKPPAILVVERDDHLARLRRELPDYRKRLRLVLVSETEPDEDPKVHHF